MTSVRDVFRPSLLVLGVLVAACIGSAAGSPSEQPGDGAAGADPECGFSLHATLSEAIPTVGVVEWSTALTELDEVHIEFGLDESYGMLAPVELGEPTHRTLLLGMKAGRTYHYRLVAHGPGLPCETSDRTLETGELPNGLPLVNLQNLRPEATAGGFLVSGYLLTGPLFILDGDGDYVWWWYGEGEIGRVRLSYDAKHLWYSAINVAGGAPSMRRVALDGSTDEDLTPEFGDIHHDFTVLPDETVAFIEHAGALDRIVERAPDGSSTEIFELGDPAAGIVKSHANSLHYWREDATYTLSDLTQNSYVKLTRQGIPVWVLGGPNSDFLGDGATWADEHGHQMLAPERLLFFNNGPIGSSSAAVELALDLDAMTATRVWEYAPGERSQFFGDVQRLPGGNTLVTFTTAGVIHEVDADRQLVRVWSWDLGSVPGYMTQRASLYGPPP